MRRAVPVPPQDRTCADNRRQYNSMASYEQFQKQDFETKITFLKGFTGSQLMQLKNSNNVNENARYNDALATLQLTENLANSFINCINKDIIQRNDYTAKLYGLQQEIEQLRKQAQEKKEIVTEAKERSDQLDKPYNNTTWYETWFPLGRPIQKESVPVLLTASIFMSIFSLAIFLRFAGQELRFESVGSTANSFLKNMNIRKYP